MNNLSVVGAQWGDEGKGKIVDLLTEHADVVVRFSGGSNAGHTLVIGQNKVVVHQLPSGVVRDSKVCVLGDGMVIDPKGLLEEMRQLDSLAMPLRPERLRISQRAHVVLPYHRALDNLRESGTTAIGTTRRGIGPAYEDKAGRGGIRICDLMNPERLRARLAHAIERANGRIAALGGDGFKQADVEGALLEQAEQLRPFVDDTSLYLHSVDRAGKRLLFEGAQGVLLDIDHGTYPFVTSSTTLAGGACGGAGVAPRLLGEVVGVTKAYATRVGEGPFPTEIEGDEGERLRDAGGEYGATTGRPRRCGWLDLPALRYAVRVAGVQWLALTKLDVLAGMGQPKMCVGYRVSGQLMDTMPADSLDLEQAEPVYESVAGFEGPLDTCSRFEDLPAGARAFVERVEQETGIAVAVVSVGPARRQTIVRRSL